MSVQPVLALLVVLSFVAVIAGLMLEPIKADTSAYQLINTFVGMLATMASMVVSYYFGSSSASKTKDDTINMLSGGTGTSPPIANGKPKVPPPKSGDPSTIDVAGTVSGTLKETPAEKHDG